MSSKRFPEEFKIEAVKQVTDSGYSVAEVASRLGVSQHSLYTRVKRYRFSVSFAGALPTLESSIPPATFGQLA